MRKKRNLIIKHFHRNFVNKESKLLETFKTVCNKVLHNVSRTVDEELTHKAYQGLSTVLSACKLLHREGNFQMKTITTAS